MRKHRIVSQKVVTGGTGTGTGTERLTMAPLANENENKGDFKDQQFGQNEVADKAVEQCKFILSVQVLYVYDTAVSIYLRSLRLIVFFIRLLSFIASSVIDDEKHARVFYKYVMGGGGFDIHYGIFRKPSDTVYESSKATNERLLTCLDWTHPVTKDSSVLDLGSGHGGISHEVRCFWLHCFVLFLVA